MEGFYPSDSGRGPEFGAGIPPADQIVPRREQAYGGLFTGVVAVAGLDGELLLVGAAKGKVYLVVAIA